jgi:pimeloyl-ACP methyl ester carboxylesterase
LKLFKRLILILLSFIGLFILTVLVAKLYNYLFRSPRGQDAVYQHRMLEIGGIPQYIQIRGQARNNPVVLVLHGGPASPMSYYAYHWQDKLEDQYTFVNWDQRGAGRTYYASPIEDQEVTTDNILKDLDEIIEIIRLETRQDKVILLGHSWGTLVGNLYVRQHPEKIDRLIAIGQVVNKEGEMIAVQEAIRLANLANDFETVDEIETRRQKVVDEELTIQNILALRQATSKYLPSGRNMSLAERLWMGLASPDAGLDDYRFFFKMMTDLESVSSHMTDLVQTMGQVDFLTENTYFHVPYYIIQGEEDWVTPTPYAQAYAELISGPDVEFIQIKHAGHSPFLDKVGDDFLQTLEHVLSK